MNEERILATVISFNRRAQLAQALEGILAQKGAHCDILVVDNASNDGTPEMVSALYSKRGVQLLQLDSNTGCAGGIYHAVQAGVSKGYDRIWIMDDDVIPDVYALSELVRADHSLNGEWGFLSSAAYWKDGTLCKANIQKKSIFRFVTKKDYLESWVRIIMASICSLYLNANAVKAIGLPIAEYFFYTEDYEYTSRVSREYPSYLVPASRVTHNMLVNAKANIAADSPDRMWRYAYLYRNDVHCYSRLGPHGWVYLLLKFVYTAANIVLNAQDNRRQKIRTLAKGYVEGIRFRPKIENCKRDSGLSQSE